MHARLIQTLVNHMLARGFDHAAANVVALLQVGLVAPPLGIVRKIGALHTPDLGLFWRAGLPILNALEHLGDAIGFHLCRAGFLPLTRTLGLRAVHGVGYLGKVLTGMIE